MISCHGPEPSGRLRTCPWVASYRLSPTPLARPARANERKTSSTEGMYLRLNLGGKRVRKGGPGGEGEVGDSKDEDEEDVTEEVDGEEDEEEVVVDPVGVLKGVSQSDVVVAKFIRGIDNDIFIRGEGPGLSWDEGIPMTFLEIGKSSWSPSDKSVPMVIQLFKNDEEPDANGKIELEPSEKVEISPDFPD